MSDNTLKVLEVDDGFPVAFFRSAVQVESEDRHIELVGLADRRATPVPARSNVSEADSFELGESEESPGSPEPEGEYLPLEGYAFQYGLSMDSTWDWNNDDSRWEHNTADGGVTRLGFNSGWWQWWGFEKIKFHINPAGNTNKWAFETYDTRTANWTEIGSVTFRGETEVVEYVLTPNWSLCIGAQEGRMVTYNNSMAQGVYLTGVEFIPPGFDSLPDLLNGTDWSFTSNVVWNASEQRVDATTVGSEDEFVTLTADWADGLQCPTAFQLKINSNNIYAMGSGVRVQVYVDGEGWITVAQFDLVASPEDTCTVGVSEWPANSVIGLRIQINNNIQEGGWIRDFKILGFGGSGWSGGGSGFAGKVAIGDATRVYFSVSHTAQNGSCKVTPVFLDADDTVLGVGETVELAATVFVANGRYFSRAAVSHTCGAHNVFFHVSDISVENAVHVSAWAI